MFREGEEPRSGYEAWEQPAHLGAGGVEVEVAVVCLRVEVDSCCVGSSGFRSCRLFGGIHAVGDV